ncbi:MAG: hypothetical protein QOG10_2850 [Kribbellaceae bacterium]|nr:hypothetical protein [Kribbellaceae bacterium]
MDADHGRHARRNAVVVGATGAVLGLLFLYPTSTNRTDSSASAAVPAGIVSTKPATGKKTKVAVTITVNGASASTQYGPVRVSVTIKAGRIVSVKAVDYPSSGGRDREISAFALPELGREAVKAQSAQIDTVSGATFTSDGYRRSLQSALDAAHFHASAGKK